MKKHWLLLVVSLSLLLGACLGAVSQEDPGREEGLSAIVYKDPT